MSDESRPLAPGAEPSPSTFVPKAGVVIAQKYRLEKRIQRGGMGEVWTATHISLDTHVAIKFMTAKVVDITPLNASPFNATPGKPTPAASGSNEGITDDGILTRVRFEREAKAAARIRSSNVVQILDHGIDHDTPYIVMELLRGEDLGTRLKVFGRLSIKEMDPIVTAVARALHMAHGEGLVHRDLKPENIFLALEGDEEIPKILDFGVAKTKAIPGDRQVDGTTTAGVVLGTPSFMSPEQIQGSDKLDHRSDLWSFAVVIYRALTGQLPFGATMLVELALQVCTAPIPTATSLVPSLDPALDGFFAKALCRDPDGRFQSARELATAFRAISQAHTTGRATVPSWQDRLPTPGPIRAASRSASSGVARAVTVEDKPNEDKQNEDKPNKDKAVASPPPSSKMRLVLTIGVVAALGLGVGLTFWVKRRPIANNTQSLANADAAQPVTPTAPAATPPLVPSAALPETQASAAAPSPTPSSTPAASSTSKPLSSQKAAPLPPAQPQTNKTSGTTKKRNVGY